MALSPGDWTEPVLRGGGRCSRQGGGAGAKALRLSGRGGRAGEQGAPVAAAQGGGAGQGSRLARCWHCPPVRGEHLVWGQDRGALCSHPRCQAEGPWAGGEEALPPDQRYQPRWPGPRCPARRAAAHGAALMSRPSPVRRAFEEGGQEPVPAGSGRRHFRQAGCWRERTLPGVDTRPPAPNSVSERVGSGLGASRRLSRAVDSAAPGGPLTQAFPLRAPPSRPHPPRPP